MATHKVLYGQNLLDFALEHAGDVSAALPIALHNGGNINMQLTAGQELEVLPEHIVAPQIVAYYKRIGHHVATGTLRHYSEEYDFLEYEPSEYY